VRGVGELLDPLALLGPAERSRLRLLIFSETDAEVRGEVEAHAARDCVEVRPALGYFDFLATATRLDWLIVTDAIKPASFPVNPYLPSKYADYGGSGSRIWGVVEEGSVLSGSLLDARSVAGDASSALDVLRGILA